MPTMTARPMYIELTQEALERAQDECMWIMQSLVARNLGTTGATYGSRLTPIADRVLAFVERAENGALDMLFTVNPTFGRQYVRDFLDDYAKLPMNDPALTSQIDRISGASGKAQQMLGIPEQAVA